MPIPRRRSVSALGVALASMLAHPSAALSGDAGTGASPPPILTDPRAALAHARLLRETGGHRLWLRAAEIELLSGDPGRALETVRAFEPQGEDEEGRQARIELDAQLALGDRRGVEQRVAALARHAGWSAHVRRQAAHLRISSVEAELGRFGLAVFAVSLAILLLTGGRELLRIRRETLVFAGAVGVVLGAMSLGAPALLQAAGLSSLSSLAMVHASAASARRLAPGPRGRIVLLMLLLLGSTGAVLAVLSRIDLSHLMAAFWA